MSMGGTLLANSKARESSIKAVVVRCGCNAPASHVGLTCPRPRAREDLGTVAYWNRNPLRRWAWHAGQLVSRTFKGS